MMCSWIGAKGHVLHGLRSFFLFALRQTPFVALAARERSLNGGHQ